MRTYGFLVAILPYTDPDRVKLSTSVEEDPLKRIRDAIDVDSDRVEKRAV